MFRNHALGFINISAVSRICNVYALIHKSSNCFYHYRIRYINIRNLKGERKQNSIYSIVNVVVGVGPYIAVAAKLLWKPSSLVYACCYLLAITNTCFQVINIQIFTDPSISGMKAYIHIQNGGSSRQCIIITKAFSAVSQVCAI